MQLRTYLQSASLISERYYVSVGIQGREQVNYSSALSISDLRRSGVSLTLREEEVALRLEGPPQK